MYARNDGNRPLQSPSGSSWPTVSWIRFSSSIVHEFPPPLFLRTMIPLHSCQRNSTVPQVVPCSILEAARSLVAIFLAHKAASQWPSAAHRGFREYITAIPLHDLRSWDGVMPLRLDLPYAGSFSLVWVSSAKLIQLPSFNVGSRPLVLYPCVLSISRFLGSQPKDQIFTVSLYLPSSPSSLYTWVATGPCNSCFLLERANSSWPTPSRTFGPVTTEDSSYSMIMVFSLNLSFKLLQAISHPPVDK